MKILRTFTVTQSLKLLICGLLVSVPSMQSLAGVPPKINGVINLIHNKNKSKSKQHTKMKKLKKLAGPYARQVRIAAHKAHVPSVLVAAVVYVENGGDFQGSTTRVSPAGAIGVMQLEPATAWDVLHVNPWQAQSNIDGGAKFLHQLLRLFHGNTRLALEAYNAGPTLVANGGQPYAAIQYAQRVIELTL